MNLYLRLLRVLLMSAVSRRIGALDESRLRFRVWPHDCDVNLHLTNARYLALCDLARIYLMGQAGILFKLIRRGWLPVAQAQEVSYFRGINPFRRFDIVTRLVYWDDKYWYTEHRFVTGDRLCAIVQVRGVFVHKGKVLPMPDIVGLTGQQLEVPAKSPFISSWQELIETKKGSLNNE